MKTARKVLKILGRVLLAIFALLLLVWLLIQTSPVQNYIIRKATAKLSKDLNTEVRIQHISLSLFDKLNLEGTLIRDQHKDTLLYAGALKVRITDWFFIKKNTVIRYVGLEDAVINLHRKNATWNYQFIADHFASGTAKKTGEKPLQLGLEKVDFKNVSFTQNDEWRGQKMQMKMGSLLLQADSVDLEKNRFVITSIDLDKPLFALYDFEGLRPDSLRPKTIDTGLYFNESGLQLLVKKINLTNGNFISEHQDTLPVNTYFDGEHIYISKLNGTINNFSFLQDTIKADVNLSAHERSGFELKKLKANVRLTPQLFEFKNLDLRTPKSHLGNYYAMKFDDFNDDMNKYVDSVVMDANFKNASVSSDDIAFFAPALKNWKRQGDINGHFYGKVIDFSVPNLFIRSGGSMYATGSLRMKGLPDIDHTIITLNGGNVQMSYTDLTTIVPQLKDINSPNLAALGLFRYTGNFDGTLYNFSANGNISSAIGGVSANLNMQLPEKGEPKYSGKIITKQFDLGRFINTPSIGLVSFNGSVSGSSFNIAKIKTSLNGTFSQFAFNNYNYSNINFNGNIQNKFFNGDLKISDPNFDFTSNVEIDLTQDQPKFNVLGDLASSNLKTIHFTNENFQLTGLFDLNFQGKNIDEFRGDAKILNAVLLHDSSRLSFDSLTLSSYYDSISKRVLYAQSNEFDVMISGQYNILDLPNSFQAFLNHYYPSYINPPKATPKNQNFYVSVNTRDFNSYAQVIDARLHGLNNVQLTGSVNTEDSGKFAIAAYVPDFGWDKFSVENATFHGNGNFTSLALTGTVDKMQVSDSTYFPNTKMSIQSQNDHSVVHIQTSANNTLNDAQLNADVYTLPDGVKVDFQPSSFIINEKKWNLEQQGEVIVRKGFASAQNVKFVQGSQEITIEPDDTQEKKGNSLVVRLKDINIGDFTPIFTKEPRMEGIANGEVYLSDFYGNFRAEADIRAEQFRMNNDSIGVVNANAAYNIASGNIDFAARSDNEAYNFDVNGGVNIKDTTVATNIAMHLNKTKIGIVNMFLSDLFSNITGLATGDLSVITNKAGLNLQGAVSVENASLLVNYTQVHYTVDSARFIFNNDGIDFGQFTLKDDNNRTGTVRGKLYEHGFANMQYDFDMATDKMLLLNTTSKDNQQFYGRAIGRAALSLKGPQENMKLSITGSVNDSTHIYIPTNNSSKSSEADFVVFKQYGILQQTVDKSEQSNLSVDLDLTANNQAQIDVILDPVTGDVIKATGNGRLQIKVPATGSMTMKGRYNIERGKYDFNFQSLLKRPFELLPDGYIEWNGDPYDADIHIDAQYTADRVSINDLISNQSAGTNSLNNAFSSVSGYRGDVYVIAQLRDRLTQPKITFRLDFPQGSAIKNDNNFNLFLSRLQSDDNEMLKQVTYLIVFNSFAPYGEVTGNATNPYSLGVNTLSQKITTEVNRIIGNLLYKITGDKNLQLDIAASTYSSSSITGTAYTGVLDRQQIGIKINKSLLDGKVIITFGGDFDFGLSSSASSQNGNFQWLPDVSVQIVLSRDRKLRAIIFNRSSLTNDGITTSLGRRNRQGISLNYTKDFEKLGDLWKGRQKNASNKK